LAKTVQEEGSKNIEEVKINTPVSH